MCLDIFWLLFVKLILLPVLKYTQLVSTFTRAGTLNNDERTMKEPNHTFSTAFKPNFANESRSCYSPKKKFATYFDATQNYNQKLLSLNVDPCSLISDSRDQQTTTKKPKMFMILSSGINALIAMLCLSWNNPLS